MGANDMNHMQHLESVALSDVAVLQSKESTYQGSWKRAGGRSAWFMARRNMDRLMIMMKAKEVPDHIKTVDNVLATLQALDNSVHYGFDLKDPGLAGSNLGLPGSIEATRAIIAHLKDAYTADDIFGRIAQKPKGEDGTVLACVRDLRRYLTLVEAEMIAEGVVENEVNVGQSYPKDVYTMIADETGIPRVDVKRKIYETFYKPEPPPAPDPGPAIGGAFTEEPRFGGGKISEKDVVFVGAREMSPSFDSVYVDGKVHTQHGSRLPTEDELAAMGRAGPIERDESQRQRPVSKDENLGKPYGTPEDGAQHASVVPWEIGIDYHDTLVARVGADVVSAFYNARASYVWRLESVVNGTHRCPREIKDCYEWHQSPVMTITDDASARWVLRRDSVPAELDDQFPRIQHEMNKLEYEQSDADFRFMYYWIEGTLKWCLQPQFQAWARLA